MDSTTPHVLIFPMPIQGHVNSMLRLAQLLCLANLKVTFLNSTRNHHRLLRHSDARSRMAHHPGFRLEAIPDGLPEDHPRSGERVMDLYSSLESTTKPLLKEILLGLRDDLGLPVTCFIVDGILGFAYEVGEQVGVPVVAFRTIGASCFWAYFCIPRLLEAGEIPIKDETMDEPVKGVPGMEAFLRQRDLPRFYRDISSPSFQAVSVETQRTPRANSLILNTFEELEGPILSLIRTHCSPVVYSIGPLHAQLRYRLDQGDRTTSDGSWVNSLWEVDRSCIEWLDGKPEKSVVYVSFGSIAVLSKEELREFWAGLVMSKKSFLWVIRPDLITGKDSASKIEPEIMEGTKERGYMVSWAPQEEVLAHPAVGGFLTHSGWNSTLESIVAGVPMLCWPFFADQQLNSRCVEEAWKIGLDMKDSCQREIVVKMVNSLMEGKKDELERSMGVVSQSVKKSVAEGGISYSNLDRLIEDIRKMSKKTQP